jgi:hypothetical protein
MEIRQFRYLKGPCRQATVNMEIIKRAAVAGVCSCDHESSKIEF